MISGGLNLRAKFPRMLPINEMEYGMHTAFPQIDLEDGSLDEILSIPLTLQIKVNHEITLKETRQPASLSCHKNPTSVSSGCREVPRVIFKLSSCYTNSPLCTDQKGFQHITSPWMIDWHLFCYIKVPCE